MVILKFAGSPGNDAHLKPGGASDGGVVQRRVAVGAVRGEDRREVEALRGLRPPEAVARQRGVREAVLGAPEGIDGGQGGKGRDGGVERGEDGGEQRRRGEGPGGVVDEDAVGGLGGERLEAGEHRSGAGLGACHRAAEAGIGEAAEGIVVERAIVGMNDDLHDVEAGKCEERVEGAAQHRAAAETQILLGRGFAEALAPSGSHDQDCGLHHVFPISLAMPYKAASRSATMPRRTARWLRALVTRPTVG